ncbi:uncharacterized protein LOC124414272 [Diprion similis]|uniref:uncharacterized protein LOC124414272 n=1 Tax=Diprion similis TaxID=362088 RepID=UPI001EF7FD74|nr:uncharacterized protein LOC124414272 [Diprion similis]
MSSDDAKYPCIICQQLTNSISDLHNHQKYLHTSEELSMSVIHLVHYMCMERNLMSVRQLFEIPNYSLTLQQNCANVDRNSCPAYVPNENGQTPLQLRCSEENSSLIVPNKWEIEFGKVEEISDETFFNSVNGICRDLVNIMDRERKNCDKFKGPKTTPIKCRSRKVSARTAVTRKNDDKNHSKTLIRQEEKANRDFLQNVTTD